MNKQLGNRIKALRELRGLSQEQVAEKCETASAVVSRWETGKYRPTNQFQEKLAAVLEVTVDDFYVNSSRVVPEGVLLKEIISVCSRLNENEQLYILDVVKGLERINHAPVEND